MTSSKWLPGTLLASALLIVAGCVLLGTTGNSASSLLQERLEMSPAAMRHLAAAAKKAGAAPPRGAKMTSKKGEYADEIRATVERKFRKLLPALATEAAHEATLKTFAKLRGEMVKAGVRTPLHPP
ncbi:hypothetical protein T484DRAFT_1796797 [Baffinella frigidus]|nr:hypothetical protein T484DRAFT_1796797 [Cryptophyta sp. CCMP2293]